MTKKVFVSQADLEEKQISFVKPAEGAYVDTAEAEPKAGVVIGDDGVMVIDTLATPAIAQDLIARIREVTDKPVKYVVLIHYHAVRVLGASAYKAEHCVPFDVTRAYEEVAGYDDPCIRTAQRDKEMWQSLEGE